MLSLLKYLGRINSFSFYFNVIINFSLF